jgi:hypothetical protein
MNELKKKYLQRIRKESAYSFLRGFLNVVLALTLVVSAISLFYAFIAFKGFSKSGSGYQVFLSFFGIGTLLPIVGYLGKQSGLLLIDIADSITDLNSRYEEQ